MKTCCPAREGQKQLNNNYNINHVSYTKQLETTSWLAHLFFSCFNNVSCIFVACTPAVVAAIKHAKINFQLVASRGGARPRDPKGAELNLTYLWKVLSVLEGSVSEWACLRHRAGIKGRRRGISAISEETAATGGSLSTSLR